LIKLQADQATSIRILGIDPGTHTTGVGIIDITRKGDPQLCWYGTVKTKRNANLPVRLHQIYHGLMQIIDKYKPDQIAMEDIFYSENIKTAIVMGHARGVSLLAVVNAGISPAEYSPREVKLAVVGRGSASKDQVQFMVKNILRLQEDIKPADAADALAVALCHYHRMQYPG
jgi:crossover junction endodeoxyribonuclease RuvC